MYLAINFSNRKSYMILVAGISFLLIFSYRILVYFSMQMVVSGTNFSNNSQIFVFSLINWFSLLLNSAFQSYQEIFKQVLNRPKLALR